MYIIHENESALSVNQEYTVNETPAPQKKVYPQYDTKQYPVLECGDTLSFSVLSGVLWPAFPRSLPFLVQLKADVEKKKDVLMSQANKWHERCEHSCKCTCSSQMSETNRKRHWFLRELI